MKKLFISTFLCFIITGSIFHIYGQETEGISVSKYNNKIYKFFIPGNAKVNCVAVIGKDGIMLIDDGLGSTAEALNKEIRKLSDKPVKFIINTHFHGDHTGGNQYFGKDAKIIAHKNAYKILTSGESLLLDLPKESLPGILIEKESPITFDGEDIKLIPFVNSHSAGDLVAYFQKSNIAVCGDLLFSDRFPFIDINNGGNVDNYFKALKYFTEKLPENTTFIAGHGRDYKKVDMIKHLDILKKTYDIIAAGLKSGKSPDQLIKEDILKEYETYATGFINKNAWIETLSNSISSKDKPLKITIIDTIVATLYKKDVKAMIELYLDLKKNHADKYRFDEAYLNALGYTLMNKNRIKDAIEVFLLNVEEYPKSSNAYDSLGEGYMNDGNKELAIKNYKKSLDLNPANDNAVNMIKKMENK